MSPEPRPDASLPTRVISSLVGVVVLSLVLWEGRILMFLALVFILVLGSLELRYMLRNKGIELNMAFLIGGGLVMLLFSLPQLHD
ncbi:MAG: phosphatidate cytidylyltransferase, partial [Meiothermus sp.]|nr:phosphatidate cytidylyltransferase [Meiothermus sp.]